MRLSHDPAKTHASFDDPNLVSRAGLVPVMALARRCGLADLVGEHVTIASPAGVNPHLKIPCLVAGMAAGTDSIDDMDVLRHGAMMEVFGGIRAPSTLESFLRSFTWGNVRQLDAVARQLLAELASRAPLLPGADVLAFADMDSMQKRVYGHARDGAGFGHTKIQGKSLMVRGLNALAAVISTPLAAPVITAARLRGGTANSARGAACGPRTARQTRRHSRRVVVASQPGTAAGSPILSSWLISCSQTLWLTSAASASLSSCLRQMDHTNGAYRSTRSSHAGLSSFLARVTKSVTDRLSLIGLGPFRMRVSRTGEQPGTSSRRPRGA